VQDTVRVIDSSVDGPELPIVVGPGSAKAVIWPGNGAKHRSMHLIRLQRGASTIDLRHPSDCVYYVLGGAGSIDNVASGETTALAEGAMLHIDAGDSYRLRAEDDAFTVLGGPCPADPSLYAHLAKE
jgi:quercetin dioxygenase-like cupin family protein